MKPVVPLSLILLLMLNLFLIPSSILIAEAQRHSAPIEIPSFLVSKVINPKISYYEPHSPIRIINNSDFETHAAIENWLGNGSELTPYMIQGIAITGPTDQNLIEIWNTTIHFQIRDCYLTQGDTGIYLRNVTNGHVFNNTITKNINRGIFLSDSENSIITNNTVTHNNITGIEIFITNNIKISGNIVSNNQGMGVVLYYSRKSIIQDNIISDNNEEGICLSMPGVRYKVTGNTIINNSRGIYLINTNYNTINGNIIANNRGNGIELYRSSNTRVAGNIVENNSEYGIAIPHVDLCGQSCAFNTIQFNNFVRNNLGGDSQAYDASSPLMLYTNFEFNYWDEWTNLTQSYSIAGEANATDSSPRMIPNHLLFSVITYPTYRWPEPLFGIVPIQWTPAMDLLGHNITYSIFYSISDGEVWLPVEQGIETPFYAWNTRSMIDWNDDVYIRINVCCEDGTWTMDEIERLVINNLHNLQTISLITPVGSEAFYGSVAIVWWTVVDLFNHSVTYMLSYSPDNGDSWIRLGTDLQNTSYLWDTSTVSDGDQYLVRVNATCSAGVGYSTTSKTFIISNHHVQPFTLFSPQGGEHLSDVITIQWLPAEDLFHHEVTYSLSYSADNGITWVILVSNLMETTYLWDSSMVADGIQYLIQVNASCNEGAWSVVTSDIFTIENNPPTTSHSLTFIPTPRTPISLQSIIQLLGLGGILVFATIVMSIIRKQQEG